jgi:hypothetical protein
MSRDWQPIESAPKDGTWVEIKWEMNRGKLDGPEVRCQWVKKHNRFDWFAEWPLGHLGSFAPTHWRHTDGKPTWDLGLNEEVKKDLVEMPLNHTRELHIGDRIFIVIDKDYFLEIAEMAKVPFKQA